MSEHKIENDAEHDDSARCPAQSPAAPPCAFRCDHAEDRPKIENRDTPQGQAGEVRQASGSIEPEGYSNRDDKHDEPTEIQPEDDRKYQSHLELA